MNTFKSYLLFLLLLSVLLPGTLCAQNTAATESNMPSSILSKELKLMVRLPEGYKTSKKRYAVLYCLKGSPKMMEEVASVLQKNHREEGGAEMIVVNIDNGDNGVEQASDPAKYDKFLLFLEKELMPVIRKKYRTNGQSILYEKSLMGSFTLYALLAKPALFNGYIAASKQWYEENNDYFSGLADKALQNPAPFKGRRIFLATLNGAYNNNNIPEVDKQMAAFAKLLESKSGGNISARYKAFDDWGIAPQPGFNEGLLFVNKKAAAAASKAPKLTMQQTKNGKWIIVDGQKKALYEVFIYDNGPDYPSEGLIRVVKNGKIGYADAQTYAIVIAPQFDCAFPFENGKAKVSNKCKTVKEGEHSMWESDAWQYVDKSGAH
jgi:predicted alpha/beta superfamily hydrolase